MGFMPFRWPAPRTAHANSVKAAAAAAASQAPAATTSMEVVRIPALSDNYVWLLHDAGSGQTAVVDPAEVAPVVSELTKR